MLKENQKLKDVGQDLFESLKNGSMLSVAMNKHKKVFDLEDDIKFISLQISNMGFNFSHAINSERLNNIYVYVNKIANSSDT